jgi:hypothetical protein
MHVGHARGRAGGGDLGLDEAARALHLGDRAVLDLARIRAGTDAHAARGGGDDGLQRIDIGLAVRPSARLGGFGDRKPVYRTRFPLMASCA